MNIYIYYLPQRLNCQKTPAMPSTAPLTTTPPVITPSTTMTTHPVISVLCQIFGIPVDPSQEQLGQIIEPLFALLEFWVNMASKLPNRWQYALDGSVSNGSVVTVAVLMSLFKEVMPSLEDVYYGKQVDDACASAIMDALWALAHTLDTLVKLSPSSPYRPCQAVEAVCDALFCVQPKEEESDGKESEADPLQRIPARPYDYLGDVLNALTAIQKQGQ